MCCNTILYGVYSMGDTMIELEDSIIRLRLGVEEYVTLRAFSIATIRNLLLFDPDMLTYREKYSPAVRDRIIVWQELLRRYNDYDKLWDARVRYSPAPEPLTIHDPLTACGLPQGDVDFLVVRGIASILDFLTADPDKLDLAGSERGAAGRISALHRELDPPHTIRRPQLKTARHSRKPMPPAKTITTTPPLSREAFIREPISSIEMNAGELKLLERNGVRTVSDFLDLDLASIPRLSDAAGPMYTRLSNWQRLYRKRLGRNQ